MIPKKSLGQHWLHDTATLQAICTQAELTSDDTVLEIGPGLGTLTRELLTRAGKVVAVEFDEALARELLVTLQAENLELIQHDILTFDLTKLPKNYKVVANIPYYLTSNLLRNLCESVNPPSKIVLLVQKEVAQRVAAKPGDMSLLSVSVQYYCDVRLGEIVPAKLFTPPPKVDSQVLILDYREKPLFTDVKAKDFFRIVKAGFSNRRKTLHNSLSGGLQRSKAETAGYLEHAGIGLKTRPQELTLQQWYELYRVLGT